MASPVPRWFCCLLAIKIFKPEWVAKVIPTEFAVVLFQACLPDQVLETRHPENVFHYRVPETHGRGGV